MIKTVRRVWYGPSGLDEAGTNCTLGVKATYSWSTQSEEKDTGANIKDAFTSKTEIEESDESWLAKWQSKLYHRYLCEDKFKQR